jgi:DNA-directed RNA polymerase specialized sigma24 family protein
MLFRINMGGAFNIAWNLLKSRANHLVRQRIPLVGAQRVDENFAEVGDAAPSRRGKERGVMMRDMGADKESEEPFDEEESVDEFHEANDNRNRRALEQMLMGLPKKRTLSEAVQAYPEEMPFEEVGYQNY